MRPVLVLSRLPGRVKNVIVRTREPRRKSPGFSFLSRPAIEGLFLAMLPFSSATAMAQTSLEDRVAAYRERVARLEDQDAVENLQAMFGYYFDKGLWSEAADLFARNGSFEYGLSGVYIGQERIRRAMLLFGPQGLSQGYLNNHMQLQPIITVAPNGRTATGRWQGPVQLSEPGANGVWGVGIYENEYVKEGGVWKISKLHFYPTAFTDYDKGWARSLLPMKGPSALFPPDKPPTVVYRSMPGNYIPPFSFNHPVTGEPLKNLPQAADSVTGRK